MEIIDSHTHWGPSLTLGVTVTTQELFEQAQESGVEKIVIFPFPSTAIANPHINDSVLAEAESCPEYIPYYYIPDTLRPIPKDKGFFGGKWHWVRGIQDSASNYDVLEDDDLRPFIEESEAVDLPLVFEEELAFTEQFVKKTKALKIIIPHLGLLGGNPLDFLDVFKNVETIYFDTALAGQGTILKFVQTIGPERVLFGSDIPFGTMRREVEKVLALNVPEREKELILSGNVKRLTGLNR